MSNIFQFQKSKTRNWMQFSYSLSITFEAHEPVHWSTYWLQGKSRGVQLKHGLLRDWNLAVKIDSHSRPSVDSGSVIWLKYTEYAYSLSRISVKNCLFSAPFSCAYTDGGRRSKNYKITALRKDKLAVPAAGPQKYITTTTDKLPVMESQLP